MIYRAIGIMSGSSLDGLDIAFVEFQEERGQWNYEVLAADCIEYSEDWKKKLVAAVELSAREYQLLHAEYGHYIGEKVNEFIEQNQLHYKVGLISSHGHTSFHLPAKKMTAQLGDGAAIAAQTGLPVVSDLRALDIAFGGQGAPIVPIGEKLLLKDFSCFLNIGGIANISFEYGGDYHAFDICAANRVLNLLAAEEGKDYDEGGQLASAGRIDEILLEKLNRLDYYQQPAPKSLANDFGTDTVYPMIRKAQLETKDALRTYVEHIALQIRETVFHNITQFEMSKLLVTGGGAFNDFLIDRLRFHLASLNVEVEVPSRELVMYKEAIVMALIGVLRWRQEYNVLSSVTGASRNSIGGAVWIGQEA